MRRGGDYLQAPTGCGKGSGKADQEVTSHEASGACCGLLVRHPGNWRRVAEPFRAGLPSGPDDWLVDDEFVVIMPETAGEVEDAAVGRLLTSLRTGIKGDASVTTSIGVVSVRRPSWTAMTCWGSPTVRCTRRRWRGRIVW